MAHFYVFPFCLKVREILRYVKYVHIPVFTGRADDNVPFHHLFVFILRAFVEHIHDIQDHPGDHDHVYQEQGKDLEHVAH